MKISLKQLNRALPSLQAAAECIVAGKIKYRFSRLLESATREIELLGKTLAEMAERHGAELLADGRFQFDDTQLEQAKTFNKEADDFMTSEQVDIWGSPEFFPFDEVEKACAKDKLINAQVLSEILFVISEPKEETA